MWTQTRSAVFLREIQLSTLEKLNEESETRGCNLAPRKPVPNYKSVPIVGAFVPRD
jgi:hypothetical protein